MQCQTISTDASSTALDIGKKLFREYPIVGEYIAAPIFLPFNGHRIDLPDNYVDRIICYDVFHHVPNQEEVIAEFGRVLKPGGIVGFSEPGRFHSQSPHSQYEMKNYAVLENDIDVNEIFEMGKCYGFTNISLKLLTNGEISLEDYNNIIAESGQRLDKPNSPGAMNTATQVHKNVHAMMTDKTVFFLYKGPYVADSRDIYGLGHSLHLEKNDFTAKSGGILSFQLIIKNTGIAIWLADNIKGIGVVKVGSHLYDANDYLLNHSFTRHLFDKDILPGESTKMEVTLVFPQKGNYRVVIDLVSEGVTWFETVGSKTQAISVTVE
jgi:hypothetical protein